MGTDKAKKAKRAAEKAKKVAEVQAQKLRALHALKTYKPATLADHVQVASSEYKGIYPKRDKWRSQTRVSQVSDNIG